MSGASPAQVLLLYRRILKAAQRFPSIKRDAIIADIKAQFREHKVGAGAVDKGMGQGTAACAPNRGCVRASMRVLRWLSQVVWEVEQDWVGPGWARAGGGGCAGAGKGRQRMRLGGRMLPRPGDSALSHPVPVCSPTCL